MDTHPAQDPRAGRLTLRRVLATGTIGIITYAAEWALAHAWFRRFPMHPNSPDSWEYGAVFVGVLAVAVVFLLGVAPALLRRRDARNARHHRGARG